MANFRVVFDDATIDLPDDWYCADCIKRKEIDKNFEMCDDCAEKPVPEDLIKKLQNVLDHKVKLAEMKKF